MRTLKMRGVLAVAVVVAASAVRVNADLIAFDDIATNDSITSVSNGYRGFNWGGGGFYAVCQNYAPSQGWADGVVSAPNAVFNAAGQPYSLTSFTAGNSFVFNSAYFASPGYVGGSPVTVTGSLLGTQVGSLSFDTTTTPVLENFNWTVDTVTFKDNYSLVFEMDNLSVSSVPEPSTLIVLSLLGALAITIGQWRQKRAASKCDAFYSSTIGWKDNRQNGAGFGAHVATIHSWRFRMGRRFPAGASAAWQVISGILCRPVRIRQAESGLIVGSNKLREGIQYASNNTF